MATQKLYRVKCDGVLCRVDPGTKSFGLIVGKASEARKKGNSNGIKRVLLGRFAFVYSSGQLGTSRPSYRDLCPRENIDAEKQIIELAYGQKYVKTA